MGFLKKEPTVQYLKCSINVMKPIWLCFSKPFNSGKKVILSRVLIFDRKSLTQTTDVLFMVPHVRRSSTCHH